MTHDDVTYDDITENDVEEYKTYVYNVLNSSFDFNTWFEHQYGYSPHTRVAPTLDFEVIQDQKSNK